MFVQSKTKKSSSKTATALVVLYVLFVAVVLVGSFTMTSYAIGCLYGGQKGIVQGEVVTVDKLHNIGMLTLRSDEIGSFPNDRLNIFLTPNTMVKVCDTSEPARGLSVSRNATVTYHEVQGLLPVADVVSERCS